MTLAIITRASAGWRATFYRPDAGRLWVCHHVEGRAAEVAREVEICPYGRLIPGFAAKRESIDGVAIPTLGCARWETRTNL